MVEYLRQFLSVDVRRCKNQSANTLLGQNNFAATVVCDKRTEQELKDIGWNVIVIWECEISDRDVLESLLSFIKKCQLKIK